jgi:hypothetical protein
MYRGVNFASLYDFPIGFWNFLFMSFSYITLEGNLDIKIYFLVPCI